MPGLQVWYEHENQIGEGCMKKHKMDPKLVAALEPWEIAYIAKHFKVSAQTVRKYVKLLGRSRKKLYAELKKI